MTYKISEVRHYINTYCVRSEGLTQLQAIRWALEQHSEDTLIGGVTRREVGAQTEWTIVVHVPEEINTRVVPDPVPA